MTPADLKDQAHIAFARIDARTGREAADCARCEPGYPQRCKCGGWVHKTRVGETPHPLVLGHTLLYFDHSCDRGGDACVTPTFHPPAPILGLAPGRIVFFCDGNEIELPAYVLEVQDPLAGIVCLRVFRGNDLTRRARGRQPPGNDFEVRAAYSETPQPGRWRWPPRT